jgi:hypothetical protein
MILTQKEKGGDRENDALHLCVCQRWIGFSEDDVVSQPPKAQDF